MAAVPGRRRQEADAQVGAGPANVEPVEVERVQRRLRPLDLSHPLAPGRDRVGLVQPAHVRDLLPQPLERGIRLQVWVDERRPARRRARNGGPVRAGRDHVLDRLLAPRRDVAADPVRVGPVQEAGRDRPREADRRPVLLPVLAHHLHDPAWLVPERLVRGQIEPGALDVRVRVDDVHEARAGLVAAGRNGAGQLLLADVRADVDALPRLDPRSESHRKIGEPRNGAVVHGANIAPPAILHAPWRPRHARGI